MFYKNILLISHLNVFRILGDFTHVLAMLYLLATILRKKSAAGVSGKSQMLYLLVFLSRYADVFTNFISVYNSTMKVLYVAVTAITVYLVYVQYSSTYKREHDTFSSVLLVLAAGLLALSINYSFEPEEILWTLSQYLESVAIVPQFWLIMKAGGEVQTGVGIYLVALGAYRVFYELNWLYRYNYEHIYNRISVAAGIFQTTLYVLFLFYYMICLRQRTDQKIQHIYTISDSVGGRNYEQAIKSAYMSQGLQSLKGYQADSKKEQEATLIPMGD